MTGGGIGQEGRAAPRPDRFPDGPGARWPPRTWRLMERLGMRLEAHLVENEVVKAGRPAA